MSATSSDPIVLLPLVKQTLKDYLAIYIEIAARDKRGWATLNLFAAGTDQAFSEEGKLRLLINADGKMRGYIIQIPEKIGGVRRADLRQLRLDPLDTDGEFSIPTIQLLPGDIAPFVDRRCELVLLDGREEAEGATSKVAKSRDATRWIDSTPDAPHCLLARIPVNRIQFNSIEIEMAASTPSGEAELRVDFADDIDAFDDAFDDASGCSLPIIADGQMRRYSIPVPSQLGPLSRENKPCLRIYPLIAAGRFAAPRVRLLPATPKPKQGSTDSSPLIRQRTNKPGHRKSTASFQADSASLKTPDSPRIMIAASPKCGNNWLVQLLSMVYVLPTPQVQSINALPWIEHDRFVFYEHFRPTQQVLDWGRENNVTFITLLRHPVDLFISLYHFLNHMAETGLDPSITSIPTYAKLIGQPLDGKSVFDFMINDFREPTISLSWIHSGKALVVRYEELNKETESTLVRLTNQIEPVGRKRVQFAMHKCTKDKMRKRAKFLKVNVRKGVIGEGKEVLSDRHLNLIREKYGAEFAALGYQF